MGTEYFPYPMYTTGRKGSIHRAACLVGISMSYSQSVQPDYQMGVPTFRLNWLLDVMIFACVRPNDLSGNGILPAPSFGKTEETGDGEAWVTTLQGLSKCPMTTPTPISSM